MIIKDLNFICTCEACPEQYDIKDSGGNQVAYVRLRWGHVSCKCPDVGGETVYQADVNDGWCGCFQSEEQREFHLNAIADAINDHLGKNH